MATTDRPRFPYLMPQHRMTICPDCRAVVPQSDQDEHWRWHERNLTDPPDSDLLPDGWEFIPADTTPAFLLSAPGGVIVRDGQGQPMQYRDPDRAVAFAHSREE